MDQQDPTIKSDNAQTFNFRQVAAQGDNAAQFQMGVMYTLGQGVKQDHKKAIKWYRDAAMQGDGNAQTNLGYFYKNGQGVKQDFN